MKSLRFRKYVKEAEGYCVALIDKDGKIVTDDCLNYLDELDEHNEWRTNEKGEIIQPQSLCGFGLITHSGLIRKSEAYPEMYSNSEFNDFLRQL